MEIISDDHLKMVRQVKIFEPQGDKIEITFLQPSEDLTSLPVFLI